MKKTSLQDPEAKPWFAQENKMAIVFGIENMKRFAMTKFINSHFRIIKEDIPRIFEEDDSEEESKDEDSTENEKYPPVFSEKLQSSKYFSTIFGKEETSRPWTRKENFGLYEEEEHTRSRSYAVVCSRNQDGHGVWNWEDEKICNDQAHQFSFSDH